MVARKPLVIVDAVPRQLPPGDVLDVPGLLAPNREVLAIATGQTVFELADSPTTPSLAQVFLNGLKARYAVDYQIDGVVLTWLSPLLLESSDSIEVIFA